jgi:ABC-type multidrug transport system fused ATPase/permease subunit
MDIRAISDWGRSNWRLTRLILVLLNISLLLLGGAVGFIAYLFDVPFLAGTVPYLVGLAMLAIFITPSKLQKIHFIPYTFMNRKRVDFIVCMLGFCLAMGMFNKFLNNEYRINSSNNYAQQVVYQAKTPKDKLRAKFNNNPSVKSYRAFKKSIHREARLLKKELRNYKSSDETYIAVLLTVLILLLAAAAGLALAALSCSIACNGSEALALIVAVLGLGGIVYLSIISIRASFRRYGKRKAKKESIGPNGWEAY